MSQRNWKVGDKVVIDQIPLEEATYTDLTGSIIEVKKSSSEIGIAVEGISDQDIEMNDLEKREGKPILWFDFDDQTVKPS